MTLANSKLSPLTEEANKNILIGLDRCNDSLQQALELFPLHTSFRNLEPRAVK